MSVDLIPFFIGLTLGLGCCLVALYSILRVLIPFQRRAKALRVQIDSLNLEQARKDATRLAQAAERISALRARVGQ